ncbi:hypothetical protein RMB03_02825 [Acinetobacter sp. V91_7]|uniref:hypothetical protein n=1 Tax=unclassified Acinetobacter TaxID=196816 RepID=UPI00287E5134|nr:MULTISPECIES: hypothetical protein [unclassified Acinetobacter]MDS7927986.1 hypothetical protein [Acinetobacter sp. V102_4]MDS7932850.1 hypothetical protein [Acinetobacter sp. V91_4B]MDS7961891.1 hypothetical protein [Acinetobacter sp. V91_7]MDS8028945.1 hypothetical protein [Acinetobacter sp. V91_13]
MNNDLLFVLSNASESYIFLTFRAKDLTHSERIDIILEVERTIEPGSKRRIHLIWDHGFDSSDLTIWSEFHTEHNLALSSIGSFFKAFEMIKYPLPTYLKNQVNTSAHFLVFPSESYVQRFIKRISIDV